LLWILLTKYSNKQNTFINYYRFF